MKNLTRTRAAWIVASVAAAALIVKLLLALETYGTNDVYFYDQFSEWSRYVGVELYRIDPLFNHPPSMIHLLHALSWLSSLTALPFAFWIRVPAILADAGNLLLVWKLLGERVTEGSTFWALVLLAAAPPLILVSGFHGNTDSAVIFFLLLSIYLVQVKSSSWAAGAAYGLAHCIKIFPLIAAPVILFNLEGKARRLKFCAATGVVVLAAWSPYFFQDPKAVFENVLGYRSSYGLWGLSFLLDSATGMAPRLQGLNAAFERYGAYLSLALVTWVSWRMHRRSPKPALFAQAGLVFFLFLSVSSGFGVQYLAWLAPWAAGLGWLPAATLYASSGVFLFLVYHMWSQGFPWYLADSFAVGDWRGYFDHVQLICWISLLVVLIFAWKQLLPLPSIPSSLRWGGALTAALAFYIILPRQLPAPGPVGGKYDGAVRSINAQSYLDLSALLSHRGRYRESIETARLALLLAPEAAAEATRIVSIDEAALKK